MVGPYLCLFLPRWDIFVNIKHRLEYLTNIWQYEKELTNLLAMVKASSSSPCSFSRPALFIIINFENVGISDPILRMTMIIMAMNMKRNWRKITCALSTVPLNQAAAPGASQCEMHQHHHHCQHLETLASPPISPPPIANSLTNNNTTRIIQLT